MKSSMTSSPVAAALAVACAEYVSGENATVDEFDRIVRAARNTITGQFCLIKTITRTHRREKQRQQKDLLKRRREYAKEHNITEGQVDCDRFKEAMKTSNDLSQKIVFADLTIDMLHRHPVTNNAPGKDRPATNLRRERQLEDIARAKANGIYAGKGRPSSIDAAQVRAMKAQGLGATAIAKELGIGRASVYRVLQPDAQPVG